MQPNTKMSSGQATFDLKAARQMCAELPGRDKLPLPDRIDREERVLRLFPAALDEIGRLRKALALKTEQHKGQAHVIGSYLGMLADFNELNESQAKRIAELEAALHVEKSAHEETKYADSEAANQAFSRIAKQRAALKKLGQAKRERGKALVEERISGEFSDWIENQCPHWDIDEEPFCAELDGPCEYHEGKCPILAELHRIAREQLRREGKL